MKNLNYRPSKIMIELKKASTHKDFETIEGLAREILPEAYDSIIAPDHIFYLLKKSHSAIAIEDQIANENYQYYLLTFNNLEVGYLGIQYLADRIIVSKLYILKSFRGKKIGTRALSFVNDMAKQFNISKIELTVHKQNIETIDIYSKNGFAIIESLSHKFENGHSLEGFKMEKVLSE
jgi:diamine N-acetyltransferase